MLNDERRGIEEAYQVAGSSSNLRVQADRLGDADVLIAAGWTPGMLGSAALRLRGEWDSSEKPRRGQDLPQELGHLARKLKSFRAVREALTAYLGPQDADAQRIIFWWLDQKCHPCGGTRFEVVKGTNRHGSKFCPACRGTGLSREPAHARRAANYLDDCVQIARTSIKKRLRPSHPVA